MVCKKSFLAIAVFGLMTTAFAQPAGKQYFLVDSRTQMPVRNAYLHGLNPYVVVEHRLASHVDDSLMNFLNSSRIGNDELRVTLLLLA